MRQKSMSIKGRLRVPNSIKESLDEERLGRDELFVKVASRRVAKEIDNALDLQMISIRLSKDLIQTFKLLGLKNGMGYQPLMREVLERFADNELKIIAKNILKEQSKTSAEHKLPAKKLRKS